MLGLAALGSLDVVPDAVGVGQPDRYLGGGGNRGRGDRYPGGFEGLHGVHGALPFVLAGPGAGGQHGLGAAGGGHAVSVAGVERRSGFPWREAVAAPGTPMVTPGQAGSLAAAPCR